MADTRSAYTALSRADLNPDGEDAADAEEIGSEAGDDSDEDMKTGKDSKGSKRRKTKQSHDEVALRAEQKRKERERKASPPVCMHFIFFIERRFHQCICPACYFYLLFHLKLVASCIVR